MKLTQQLGFSYSANRRASDPLQFYVTSLGGKTKERMDRVGDYPSWDVSKCVITFYGTFALTKVNAKQYRLELITGTSMLPSIRKVVNTTDHKPETKD